MKIMRPDSGALRWRGGGRTWKLQTDGRLGVTGRGNTDQRLNSRRAADMWTKPEFTEMRFGFEVTMYIYNR
jgi:coenzyme PQQ precursor peptide PqqA